MSNPFEHFDELEVDDFAKFVFLHNESNKHISLSLSGIDTTKDLFCFCLDMLCKGIVLLFGGEDKRVAVQDLSFENFESVCDKMKCLGIKCTLQTFETEETIESSLDLWVQNILNIQRIQNSEDNKNLTEYHFDILTTNTLYRVTFDVLHNTNDEIARRYW